MGRAWYAWKRFLDRVEYRLEPFFEANLTKPWFPPAFWALMAASLFGLALVLVQRFSLRGLVVAALLGALFGFYLPRAKVAPVRARDRLEEAAAQGDAKACRKLGQYYLAGAPGIPRERELARLWLAKGAEGGDRQAMVLLAELLATGLGGLHDPAAAAVWKARARSTTHFRPQA